MSTKFQAGLFMIGMGLGMALPSLPEPINFITPWLWILFIIIGVILLVKSN
ncbi:MAG: hypothetical protein PHX27_03390 [Candidatus ainarchaeum sp.]|nr:hypothetical protein [Candidatus ainarchaeum sp.]